MRQPADVMRERTLADAATGRVVALDVVQHLIRVEVAVVIGEVDRVGVPVELARDERADQQVGGLERLMDRWWYMKTTRAGLEVMNVERDRIDCPVPSDDVERMMVEHIAAHMVGALEPDLRRSLRAALECVGAVKIPLAERRELRELAVACAITIGHIDEAGHLH